jgi:hypothetical protein
LLAAYLWKSFKCRTAVICLMKSLYAALQTFSPTSRLQWQSQDGWTEASGCFLNIVFLLFPCTYSCHHEMICINDHFGALWSDILTLSVSYQSLVNAAMVELDMAEDATTRDGSMYENGVVWASGRRRLYGFSVTNLLDF